MKAFKVDFSFILITICFLLSPYQKEYFIILFIILVHELGHLFFIYLFKVDILSLRLYALGFLMDIDNKNLKFIKNLFIYSGGILFNFILLLILPDTFHSYIWFIIVLNLFPIYPLDGFMILKTILSYIFPYRITLWISNAFSIIALFITTILLVPSFDYLLILNLIFLFYINFKEFKNINNAYSAFMLQRYLYIPDYSYRRIKFRHNNEYYLYRYQKIYMKLEDKKIKEEEILRLKYE